MISTLPRRNRSIAHSSKIRGSAPVRFSNAWSWAATWGEKPVAVFTPMTKSSLAIAGANRLADEFVAVAGENDFEPIRCDPRTAIPAALNSLIDTESGTAEKNAFCLRVSRQHYRRLL